MNILGPVSDGKLLFKGAKDIISLFKAKIWLFKQLLKQVERKAGRVSAPIIIFCRQESFLLPAALLGWEKLLMVKSKSAETTREIGCFLGKIVPAGMVLALNGELGAGKTVFAQGFGSGLGVKETVNSPSYVLMNIYRGRLEFYHFDFYRLDEEEELFELGLDEYFYGEGVALIEWADKFTGVLPPDRLEINMFKDDDGLEETRFLHFAPRGNLDAFFLKELGKVAAFGA